MKQTRTVIIYGLICPIRNKIRYIGASVCPERRLENHMMDKSNSRKAIWIKRLITFGLTPELQKLETTSSAHAKETERKWIDKMKADGFPILNGSRKQYCRYYYSKTNWAVTKRLAIERYLGGGGRKNLNKIIKKIY